MTDPQATWNDPDGLDSDGNQPSIGSSGLGPIAERTLSRGTRVGAYEIRGELARGSMGVVYRARQVDLPEREVALKLIAAALEDPAARDRFQREGEALARLDHPNVVRVHAAGVLDDGRPYLALELVRGKNMRQVAYEAGSLSPADAARLIEPVARAVAHMHERDVLHRDLKLANVLLDTDGRPRVTDFGLAQLTDRRTRLTQSQDMIGTPLYMAPEVVRAGSSPDPRSDVYSLGVMLFRLVVGRFPFYAATPLALFHIIDRAPLELPPELPSDLAAVLACALAKRPEDRYPTATALADDLAALAAGDPISVVPVSRWTHTRRWARARRAPLVGGAALMVLAALTAVGFAVAKLRRDRASAHATELQAVAGAAEARASALAAVERDGIAPDAETLRSLGEALDAAPPPPDPLDLPARRFLVAHAWSCLMRGDRERARLLLDRALPPEEAPPELAEACAHLRTVIGEPAAVRSAETARAVSPAAPVDVLRVLDALRARPPSDPAARAYALLREGELRLRLRWPAGAAHAFATAIATFPSWSSTLQATPMRLRPGDPERWLPAGLAALCGEARARALLLDGAAAARALQRARDRAASFDPTLARELDALASGPLPAPAPTYLPQAAAELEAWRDEKRWRLLKRRPLSGLEVRLKRAERAGRLALRQGEPANRAWAGLAEVAIEQGDLPRARRCARAAASAGPGWRVEEARGRLAIASGATAAGIAGLLLAVEQLGASNLGPIARAAERYRILVGGLEALRARSRVPPKEWLPIIDRLAKLSLDVPLTSELRLFWNGRLEDLGGRSGDEELAKRGKAGGARALTEYREIRRLYKEANALSAQTHSLESPKGEQISLDLERLSPTATDAYLRHALDFLRSDPRGIDPLVVAFTLEPLPTLYRLTINLYQPESRTLWGNEQRDKVMRWVRSGRFTRGLPVPPDPQLKESLVSMHCTFMRTPLSLSDQSKALAAAEGFRGRHPRSRAAALIVALIQLDLGDPAGALVELSRAEQMHPLFPDQRWKQMPRLIQYHQARAEAELGRIERARTLLHAAIKGGVTRSFLIEEEPRFREDPAQPTSLREPFRRLLQLQREVRAQRAAKRN